jgi:hypothetical protein
VVAQRRRSPAVAGIDRDVVPSGTSHGSIVALTLPMTGSDGLSVRKIRVEEQEQTGDPVLRANRRFAQEPTSLIPTSVGLGGTGRAAPAHGREDSPAPSARTRYSYTVVRVAPVLAAISHILSSAALSRRTSRIFLMVSLFLGTCPP